MSVKCDLSLLHILCIQQLLYSNASVDYDHGLAVVTENASCTLKTTKPLGEGITTNENRTYRLAHHENSLPELRMRNYGNRILDIFQHLSDRYYTDNMWYIFIVSENYIQVADNLEELCSVIRKLTCIIYTIDGNKKDDINASKIINDIFHKAHNLYYFKKRTDFIFVSIGELRLHLNIISQVRIQDSLLNVQGYFEFIYKFLLVLEAQEDLPYIEQEIHSLNHVTAFSFANSHLNCYDNISIHSAMWTISGRKMEQIGYFHTAKHEIEQKLEYTVLFPNVNFGFNGQLILVASQIWTEFMEVYHIRGEKNFKGSYYDVLQTMSHFLNFTFDLIIPANEAWGSEVEPGLWNGIVGLLQNRSVHLAVAALTVTQERMQVMDFSNIALEHSYIVPIYRKPLPIKNALLIYFKPFERIIWLSLIGVFLIFCLILSAGITLADGDNVPKSKFFLKLLNSNSPIVFASVLKQDVNVKDKLETSTISQRLLWGSWWLFSFMIVALWASSIISFIAIPIYPSIFVNTKLLLSQEMYKIGTKPFTSVETLVKYSYPDIWKRIINTNKSDPSVLSDSEQEHQAKVSEENYVLIDEYPTGEHYIAADCHVTIAKHMNLGFASFAIGMQKNSGYIDIIDKFSLQAKEFGLMEYWKRFNKRKSMDETCEKDANEPLVLKLEDFQWWFYLFSMLLSIAILVFICEKLYGIIAVKNCT